MKKIALYSIIATLVIASLFMAETAKKTTKKIATYTHSTEILFESDESWVVVER